MKRKFCTGLGFKSNNILYAAVLSLLSDKSSYGYEIVDNLLELGIEHQSVPYGLIYRLLRDMESKGFVISQWQNEDSGPSRRVYRITESGKEYVKKWLHMAKNNLTLVEEIINFAENSLEQKGDIK